MKNVKVVVGANFGDEGKGLMTDYFASRFSSDKEILNVRHNGGAQAGHTVVLPDGRRHVCSHIGAGSFHPHVVTYFSKDFILNPILFAIELEAIKKKFAIKPEIWIHPDCRITTPYDMIINQILERSRGDNRHGSCGVGINETIVRYDSDSLGYNAKSVLSAKRILDSPVAMVLRDIRKRYVPERLMSLGVTNMTRKEFDLIDSDIIIDNWVIHLEEMLSYCSIADYSIFDRYDNMIFEGAQGLLLDNEHTPFSPHLTASRTGTFNPKNIAIEAGFSDANIEVCYATRSYFTRHGAGPFPSECEKKLLIDPMIRDKTNKTNEFQGRLRYGYFDLPLFNEACQNDATYRNNEMSNIHYSIAVTHLDETDDRIVLQDGAVTMEDIKESIQFPVAYRSYGETREYVKMMW